MLVVLAKFTAPTTADSVMKIWATPEMSQTCYLNLTLLIFLNNWSSKASLLEKGRSG